MIFFQCREPRNPELLGHGRNPVRRSVGHHTDENQNPRGRVVVDHDHRKTAVVLRFPQVRPLPPSQPPQTPSPPRSVRQVHQGQVLHQTHTRGTLPRRHCRLTAAALSLSRSRAEWSKLLQAITPECAAVAVCYAGTRSDRSVVMLMNPRHSYYYLNTFL